jgi:carboxyl-terminal processing protease
MEGAAANRYVGTGIQLRKSAKDALPEITVAFPNGPARKAGGKNGDLILEVDGVSMEGLTLSEVVDRIRGEEGTKVSFTVRQPDEKGTRRLNMTRGPVPFTTVFGYKRISEDRWQYRVNPDQPIAYLRLETILPSTPAELRKLEATLLDEGVKGIVLDLRSAGGGDVQPALLTADELLPGGLMFKVQDARHHIKEYRADKDCIFRDCKTVLLVNEYTQSAGELVAAALQDNDRAVAVGQATRGDGSVISLVHLPNDLGAVQLRTGRVERAKGKGWRPITPDHVVSLDQNKSMSILEWQHAQSGTEPPGSAPKDPPNDPQLAKALELLQDAVKK